MAVSAEDVNATTVELSLVASKYGAEVSPATLVIELMVGGVVSVPDTVAYATGLELGEPYHPQKSSA